MATRRVRLFLASSALTASALLPVTGLAGKHFRSRSRRPTLDCIPLGNYTRVNETRITLADQLTVIGGSAEAIRQTVKNSSTKDVVIEQRRKRFASSKRSVLRAGEVSLSRVDAAIYSLGQVEVTGRLSFSGKMRSVPSTTAVVRIRAYAGLVDQPSAVTQLRLVWETNRRFFLRRGRPLTISLISAQPQSALSKTGVIVAKPSNKLEQSVIRHFDEITHFEVVLEQIRDL